jgi:hypothetical protein
MDDLEKAVLKSVIEVLHDPFAGAADGMAVEKAPLADLMEKLEEDHGYDEDKLEQPFYTKLAEILEKHRGDCWSYHSTDNDGLPAEPLSVFGPQQESIRSKLGW